MAFKLSSAVPLPFIASERIFAPVGQMAGWQRILIIKAGRGKYVRGGDTITVGVRTARDGFSQYPGLQRIGHSERLSVDPPHKFLYARLNLKRIFIRRCGQSTPLWTRLAIAFSYVITSCHMHRMHTFEHSCTNILYVSSVDVNHWRYHLYAGLSSLAVKIGVGTGQVWTYWPTQLDQRCHLSLPYLHDLAAWMISDQNPWGCEERMKAYIFTRYIPRTEP